MMYRDELISSLNVEKQSIISKKSEPKEHIEEHFHQEELPIETNTAEVEETIVQTQEELEIEEDEKKSNKDKDTNWTQLLLGKLR